MTRTLKHCTIIAIAVILAFGGASVPAYARTTVAFVGRPNNPTDAGCFSEWFGSMRNTCSYPVYFTVPLTVDPAGNHWVTVYGYSATSANLVTCQAFGVSNNTTSVATYTASGAYPIAPFGGAGFVNLPATYVPVGGSLLVACTLNSGGQINLVNTSW